MREALRDWKLKRALQLKELEALKADIEKGLTDLAEGRVKDFQAADMIDRGRKLLTRPLALRLTDTAESDLAEIWADSACKASVQIATRFIASIEATLEPVRYFPICRAIA